MIRIISEIRIRDLDSGDGWRQLPMVPGTGSAEVKDERDPDKGWLRTLTLSAVIRHGVPGLTGNLQLLVVWEDGRSRVFGSPGLPVRLSVSGFHPLRVSASYGFPV